ncbi:MAG: GntR family transcriptional regulator [Planctomycetota bacterium]|nr:GntR family transcriptional regulator [Planctomycetota bacterium]
MVDEADPKGYAWLAEQLRQAILSGEIPVGASLPATKMLGRKHGISQETARRAAKQLQHEGLVASEPRQGFRVLARGNDPDRGLPLAFVVAEEERQGRWNEFHRMLFAGLQSAAAERRWPVLAVGTGGRSGPEILEQLRECRAWGIVLDSMHAGLLEAVVRLRMPVVMMDAWESEVRLDAVVQDSFQGALQAVRYLAARGHTRIGWVGKISDSIQAQERFGGFCAGLAGMGLKLRADWALDTPPEETAGAARKLLARRDRPTAAVGLWLDAARELVHAAAELGLKPGKDLEIVGWTAEELYETEYRAAMGGLPCPATMVWSASNLARAALARLAERRLHPELPPLLIKLPVRLRPPA